jgi:L-histidine Nalpha-methyltransferase
MSDRLGSFDSEVMSEERKMNDAQSDRDQGSKTLEVAPLKVRPIPYFRKREPKILDCLNGNNGDQLRADIYQGMIRPRKSIPSKYFYDACGSQFFEQICTTPEYYVTETELSILDQSSASIMRFFCPEGGDLIELGSGSHRKIKKLLDAVSPSDRGGLRYIPVDINRNALVESISLLRNDYKEIEILGIAADFTQPMGMLPRNRKLIAFLGSTIGNFTEKEALTLLVNLRAIMSPEDRFLLGIDMLKPIGILEAAYNDREGLTRNFNLNILTRVNRELNGNFDLQDFEHIAFFEKESSQIEMHLRARKPTTVRIEDLNLNIEMQARETIHTEICRKFSRQSARKLFDRAGLIIDRWYTDSREWFSLVVLKPG